MLLFTTEIQTNERHTISVTNTTFLDTSKQPNHYLLVLVVKQQWKWQVIDVLFLL